MEANLVLYRVIQEPNTASQDCIQLFINCEYCITGFSQRGIKHYIGCQEAVLGEGEARIPIQLPVNPI